MNVGVPDDDAANRLWDLFHEAHRARFGFIMRVLATRMMSVPAAASKPVCRIAVFALLVPVPTSSAASINATSSWYSDSSRAIAAPTTPAPITTTSNVGSRD